MRSLKGFVDFFNLQYSEYRNQQKIHRCKLQGTRKNDGKIEVLVNVEGIRNSVPIYYPVNDLVQNDDLLNEFSQTDVRLITFYASYEIFQAKVPETKPNNRYRIETQEVIQLSTVYTIYDKIADGYFRKTSKEIVCDRELLTQFAFDDVINIVSSASQEKTIKDLEN